MTIIAGLCGLCFTTKAQDLTGYWKGTLTMNGCFAQNNIELQIKMDKGKATGDSYHYQDIDNYVKKSIEGDFNYVEKRVLIRESQVITYHLPIRCVICVKNFNLVYSRTGNVETLSGQWDGIVVNTATNCSGGNIVLTRTKQSDFQEIPEIKVDAGEIQLDFYDNAVIDDDSISIKVNGSVILSHQRLTAKPITTSIKVDSQHPFYEVEMIAENLGSIPPNTAVLVIRAGDKKYTLWLSSTGAKSARVRFVYEPPKQF